MFFQYNKTKPHTQYKQIISKQGKKKNQNPNLETKTNQDSGIWDIKLVYEIPVGMFSLLYTSHCSSTHLQNSD